MCFIAFLLYKRSYILEEYFRYDVSSSRLSMYAQSIFSFLPQANLRALNINYQIYLVDHLILLVCKSNRN